MPANSFGSGSNPLMRMNFFSTAYSFSKSLCLATIVLAAWSRLTILSACSRFCVIKLVAALMQLGINVPQADGFIAASAGFLSGDICFGAGVFQFGRRLRRVGPASCLFLVLAASASPCALSAAFFRFFSDGRLSGAKLLHFGLGDLQVLSLS